MPDTAAPESALQETNQRFYDALWKGSRLVGPERFNTWPHVARWLPNAHRRLEVGPGLRPRLPIAGTHFVDISRPALQCLRDHHGICHHGSICKLPFPDSSFDLVCALDIIEHVDDDAAALSELARVAAPGAIILIAVPLHEEGWTAFDGLVGHRRRYAPGQLVQRMQQLGLELEHSAAYGMQPKSSRLVDLGMWFMANRHREATWVYNHILMPLGLRNQKPLVLQEGLIDTTKVDEIILVCCRRAESAG